MASQEDPYATESSSFGAAPTDEELASAGRRFWTFAIDVIAIRLFFFVGEVAYVVAYGPETYEAAVGSIEWYVVFSLLFVSYYLVLESITGRTLGKILLRTRVVTESGARPSLKVILIRTVLRHLPFEPVSFTLNGEWWHDSLSKTKVIRTRRSS